MTAGGQKGRAASWTSTASAIDRGESRPEPIRPSSAPPSIKGLIDVAQRLRSPMASWPAPTTTRTSSHRRMTNEAIHGMGKQRLAVDAAILLGYAAAEALAGSGGNDEGGNGHCARLAPLGALL